MSKTIAKMPTKTQVASMMGMTPAEMPKTFFGKVKRALQESRLISSGLQALSGAPILERYRPILSALGSFASAKGFGKRRIGRPRKRRVVRKKVGGARIRKPKSVTIRL